MSLFIDTYHESVNKHNEELCGDKVEIIRGEDFVNIVLADGLGSGVKANILATMTSKIIGTMLANGVCIDEAVETITNTLPVCKERGIAYSTFSILQIHNSGEGYLVEFDNPAVFMLREGRVAHLNKKTREINDKIISESRFRAQVSDVFIMVSDGAIHAGIGKSLNLGWQWTNVAEYLEKVHKKDISARNIAKLLLSACDNLYMQKPGDDTTVVAVKLKQAARTTVMVGPPVDRNSDGEVVKSFLEGEGKKVICGGTTSQIVSRITGRQIKASLNYHNPTIPPIAEIRGIDLTTEGVLTLGRALEHARDYLKSGSIMQDVLKLNNKDGAARLAKLLLEESTDIRFLVGRAMNPAHQHNQDLPVSLSMKLKLVEEMAMCIKSTGKTVEIEYY